MRTDACDLLCDLGFAVNMRGGCGRLTCLSRFVNLLYKMGNELIDASDFAFPDDLMHTVFFGSPHILLIGCGGSPRLPVTGSASVRGQYCMVCQSSV